MEWIKYLIIALLLAGCDKDQMTSGIELYKCTAEQLILVEKETAICGDTGYMSSYCYRTAKKTQCDRMPLPEPPK